jgi:hypothetical protein
VKRPTRFRPIFDGLEIRSLLSSLPSAPHLAVDVLIHHAKAGPRLPPSATTLTSSASQSTYGSNVTFTATVLAGKRKAGNPTGTVTFKDGNTVLAIVPVSIKKRVGTTTFKTTALGPGSHAVVATYSGNKRLASSSNATPMVLQVSRVTTTLTLTSPDASAFGAPATFTAKVVPSVPNPGLPTGTVAFIEGGTVLAIAPLRVVNGVAQATLTTSSLSTGSHAIVATYSGDGNFSPGSNDSAPRTTQVVPAATTLKVTNSTTFNNVGDTISSTATVTPSGSPPILPTGTVSFYFDFDPTLHPEPLQVVDGVAQATYSFQATVGGLHMVFAIYSGDANFSTSRF